MGLLRAEILAELRAEMGIIRDGASQGTAPGDVIWVLVTTTLVFLVSPLPAFLQGLG